MTKPKNPKLPKAKIEDPELRLWAKQTDRVLDAYYMETHLLKARVKDLEMQLSNMGADFKKLAELLSRLT